MPLLQVCTSSHINNDALLLQQLCLPAAFMPSASRHEWTWVSGLGRCRASRAWRKMPRGSLQYSALLKLPLIGVPAD